jgi:hypothetical protein
VLSRLTRRSAAIALPAAILIVASSSAAATVPPTRGDYVAAVEPICKQEVDASEGTLQGVEGMVEAGRFQPAARRLRRAAAALREAVARVAPLPRPPADATRLARWLGHARHGGQLLGRVADALEREDRPRAQRLAGELLQETRRANATVVGFDFEYCRLNPARFV